ncbi:MAG: helix-turn-helix transcriptional regulator [Alphaproteobacteria bacterium]|nr:helix-turn-helix transcriptional regulator [Alphaproteobacteria bacterium]
MVLNDTYADIIAIKVWRNLTWDEIASRMGMQYLQNAIDAAHRGNLPENFVKLAEVLGCDIEINFVENTGKAGEK